MDWYSFTALVVAAGLTFLAIMHMICEDAYKQMKRTEERERKRNILPFPERKSDGTVERS